MTDPTPLHGYPLPDPHWLASVSASVAADALGHLLAAAIDLLDWIDDDDVEDAQAILQLASELVIAITDDADDQPPVLLPRAEATRTAIYLSEAADLFETHKTYDGCRDTYDKTAIAIVAGMRETARELRKAALTA